MPIKLNAVALGRVTHILKVETVNFDRIVLKVYVNSQSLFQ